MPTVAEARAVLTRFVEEWVPWSLEFDRLTDDQLLVTVAAIARERDLKLPGVTRAVAALAGVPA